MECADGDKQNGAYFTRSNGGIFSEKILKPQRSSKTLLAYVRKVKVFFLRCKKFSDFKSRYPTLCKECNHATCTGDK